MSARDGRMRPAAPWRVLAQDGTKIVDLRVDCTDFDEVVVSRWLHVERMSARDWSVIIGDLYLAVRVTKGGEVEKVTLVEGEIER